MSDYEFSDSDDDSVNSDIETPTFTNKTSPIFNKVGKTIDDYNNVDIDDDDDDEPEEDIEDDDEDDVIIGGEDDNSDVEDDAAIKDDDDDENDGNGDVDFNGEEEKVQTKKQNKPKKIVNLQIKIKITNY